MNSVQETNEERNVRDRLLAENKVTAEGMIASGVLPGAIKRRIKMNGIMGSYGGSKPLHTRKNNTRRMNDLYAYMNSLPVLPRTRRNSRKSRRTRRNRRN